MQTNDPLTAEASSPKPVPAPSVPPKSTPPGPTPAGQGGVAGKIFFWVVLLALLGGAGFWFKQRQAATLETKGAAKGEGKGDSKGDAKGGPGGGRPAAPPVPVVTGKVMQKDVPIYLDGLGTVQAYNSVTVRVRVDGQLEKVAFTEGQEVKEGDVLALIDAAPFRTQVEQAEARKAQDEVQLANARVQLRRNGELLASKILPQQDFDNQKALVDQLEATIKADQAAVDSAKVQLNYTRIVAPISGRTGIRQVDQGNIVKANDANGLVVIAQLRPITVNFTLPEQNLNEIQTQMRRGELPVLAVDRDNTTVLGEGKLAVIDNQIDSTTGTIRLKATFPNNDLRLWPGQFVNARLLASTRTNGVVVPATVVQRGPDGPYAFVVNEEDSSVKVRPLKVALMTAGQAVIESGLQPGETVVVDGQYKLQPGSKVQLGQAPGKPAGGGDARPKRPKQ